jgi:hypothetical protein
VGAGAAVGKAVLSTGAAVEVVIGVVVPPEQAARESRRRQGSRWVLFTVKTSRMGG